MQNEVEICFGGALIFRILKSTHLWSIAILIRLNYNLHTEDFFNMGNNFIKLTFDKIGISNDFEKWPCSSEKLKNIWSNLVKLVLAYTVGLGAALLEDLCRLHLKEDVVCRVIGQVLNAI